MSSISVNLQQQSPSSIDLSVFHNPQQRPSSDCTDYKSCIAINRLLACLKNYKALKLESSINNENIFSNFMNTVYKHDLLIEDFYHLMKNHDKEIYYIMKNINHQCDIDKCLSSSRHYRVYNNNNDNTSISEDDSHLNIYCDTLDSLHVYLIHSHEMGMRIITKQQQDDHDDDITFEEEKKDENDWYDPEFARYQNIISSKRKKTNRFKRIGGGNKFKIQIGHESHHNEEDDKIENEDNEDGITYLDAVIIHLKKQTVKQEVILKLIKYLQSEQYETDSIDLDLSLTVNGGNIAKYMINDEECLKHMTNMFNKSRSSASFFV